MNPSMYTNFRDGDSQPRFFLVNTDCMALVLRSKGKSGDVVKDKELQIGTVLRELVTDRHDRVKSLQRCRQLIVTILDADIRETYAVDIKHLMPIIEDDAFLFLSVQRPRERMQFWQNKQLMNEAKTIKEGTLVHVSDTSKSDASLPGIVTKKGSFPGYLGTQFSVKLFESGNAARDDSNYLICPFYKLRVTKNRSHISDNSINIGAKIQQQLSPNSSQALPAKSQENKPFRLNERVVWLSDKETWECGTVRHLGVLPGETDVLVGVEFDNAVGTGDGRYHSKTLFKTQPKHGAFIPIEELKRKKDVHSSSRINFFKKKKKESDRKPSGSSTFYDDKLPISEKEIPKPFREYEEKPMPMPLITLEIAKQVARIDDCPKVEVKSSSSSPKSRKQTSPLPSPSDLKDGKCDYRSLSRSPPFSSTVHVKRFPTSTTEPSSPTLNQEKRFANEHACSGRSTSVASTVHVKRFPTSATEPSSPTLNQEKRFANEHACSGRSTSVASTVHVKRFPTSTTEPSSPTLNQEKRFANEHACSGRSTSVASFDQQRNPKDFKTVPSPTQHKRNSSALETQLRERSTQSSDRSVKSDFPVHSKTYDYMTKSDEFSNEKAKDEKKIELFSEKVKNGKMKSKENVNLKTENTTILKIDSRGSHKTYSPSPESPNTNDYYHVMKDDCLPPDAKDIEVPFYDDLDKFLSLTDYFDEDQPVEQTEFGVGSVVEVTITGQPWYGVIRWIGVIEAKPKIAGLEMDETHAAFCDGELNGERHFKCPFQKGFFVYLHLCRKDSRFLDSLQVNINDGMVPPAFGSKDCPIIAGEIPPLSYSEYVIQNLFGKNKGIQGHHNSCYLDATLFSMFSFTPVFDDLLNRPGRSTDIDSYCTVQRVLKEEIVNPLRRNMYVRADRVMGLRTLLDKLSSVSGLTSEEKDPEEFLNSLLHQILKAEPYLKLSSGQEAFFYQLFIEKKEQLRVPTVQQLFDQSFLTSDIKLKEIPSCLIIQMPRHGKQYKMYNRIFPSPILDITEVLEDTPRDCCICGMLAQYECRDCFYACPQPFILKSFCNDCVRSVHQHEARVGHKTRKIKLNDHFRELTHTSRVTMELFAVVCIETSHYVAFAKCGTGNEADVPWCFFDSMADRKGEQNGYNIPEIQLCPDLSDWLSEEGLNELEKNPEKQLPEMPKRLFGDAYLCMYQNSSVMMYH